MRKILYLIILLCIATVITEHTRGQKAENSRKGVITGRVLLEDGSPAEGIDVWAFRSGVSTYTGQSFFTDNEGNFTVTGLVPGLYELRVNVAGYTPSTFGRNLYRIGDHVTIRMIKGGVITGVVTDSNGEPMVGVTIYAQRTRDAEGHTLMGELSNDYLGAATDDRGIYRLYGLSPGSYILAVNPGFGVYHGAIEIGRNTPTYHPSAMREGAAEITVHAGEEIGGINIQHRSQPGFAINGTLTGEFESDHGSAGTQVALVNLNSGHIEAQTSILHPNYFLFLGVSEGDYILYANKYSEIGDSAGSEPLRVQVRGADVTGIKLRLIKQASISGRISIEPSAVSCKNREKYGMEEIYLDARSNELQKRSLNPFVNTANSWSRAFVLSDKGEFTLNNLKPGSYRIAVDLPGEHWYVKAIDQPVASGTARRPVDISRPGVLLKSGEKLSGVEVKISEGAASLNGRIVSANELQGKNEKLKLARYRVHLIPLVGAENILRYAETAVSADGSFAFKNLMPGKYRMFAQPLPEGESAETPRNPVAWDAAERAKLRRVATKNVIELQPCQQMSDYVLRYVR
jgi:Carboxypeptidase regulatory-like domain